MLITPTSERHFIMYEALRKGATVDEIHELTKVKHWFIEQMKELVEEEEALLAYKGNLPSDEALTAAKKDGFSDKYLSQILEVDEADIREKRIDWCRGSLGRRTCKCYERQCLLLFNIQCRR